MPRRQKRAGKSRIFSDGYLLQRYLYVWNGYICNNEAGFKIYVCHCDIHYSNWSYCRSIRNCSWILFALFTFAMTKLTTRSSGFILYTNNYIKIIKKDGAESTTLSISGLKSLVVKYPHYIFVVQEGTAKVVSGGGKGFADFVDHLNERRPELIETFYQNKNVSNAYYCDRNNMHTYNY